MDEPESYLQLKEQVENLLPHVDLPEVLLEIQAKTGFIDEFTHVNESFARVKDQPFQGDLRDSHSISTQIIHQHMLGVAAPSAICAARSASLPQSVKAICAARSASLPQSVKAIVILKGDLRRSQRFAPVKSALS